MEKLRTARSQEMFHPGMIWGRMVHSCTSQQEHTMLRITQLLASVFFQVAAPAARRESPLATHRSPRREANRGWLISRDVPVSTFGSLHLWKVTLPAPGKVGAPTGGGGGGSSLTWPCASTEIPLPPRSLYLIRQRLGQRK